MKFNKWTLGLAAVGAVSLTSAVTARADSGNLSPVEAAFAGIYIEGGVDTSFEWAISPSGDNGDNSSLAFVPFRSDKQDGFNLNVVELNIGKHLDESEWASGFLLQLIMGPDAVEFNNPNNGGGGSGFTVKQAHVNLRTPVGNGIDWTIGAFNSIVGYEVFESWKNPNFTRSWAYAIEPTQHTGILGSYRVNDNVSFSVGVANTLHTGINTRNDENGNPSESWWCKTWMGSVALTAPDSWGSLAGSTFYAGVVNGWNGSDDQVNLYVGSVIKTPVEGLTAGFAYDFVCSDALGGTFGIGAGEGNVSVIGLYTSFKATEKLSFHGRGEYGWWDVDSDEGCLFGLTGTIQYDLWANVISRLELRYEASEDVADFTGFDKCALGFYANIVYVF